jgi:hypothetical protein
LGDRRFFSPLQSRLVAARPTDYLRSQNGHDRGGLLTGVRPTLQRILVRENVAENHRIVVLFVTSCKHECYRAPARQSPELA